jgi:hypothetical protein
MDNVELSFGMLGVPLYLKALEIWSICSYSDPSHGSQWFCFQHTSARLCFLLITLQIPPNRSRFTG